VIGNNLRPAGFLLFHCEGMSLVSSIAIYCVLTRGKRF